MNKLLFLDIDGVLNSHQSAHFHLDLYQGTQDERYAEFKKAFPGTDIYDYLATEFCPIAVSNLHQIVKRTGCQIVLSSTWRHGASLDDIREWFRPSKFTQDAFIDKTPSFMYGQRGEEIYYWLKKNGYTGTFAVLDDDNDMDAVRDHFFRTHEYTGLDWHAAKKVEDHLNDFNNIWSTHDHPDRPVPTEDKDRD
jgi:hypothetical protein